MLEILGMWKICQRTLQTKMEPVQEIGYLGCKGHKMRLSKPIELTSQHHEPLMQDLVFALLGFDLALVLFYSSHSPPFPFLFWNGNA
jgi:hypothetical protein